MKSFVLLFAGAVSFVSVATTVSLPPGVPHSIDEFRHKHPYRSPPNPLTSRSSRGKDDSHLGNSHGGSFYEADSKSHTRHVITMRASCNDTDNLADEFEAALHEANHGGILYLPSDQTLIIGKPLDLTFLDDIHVHLDGEIKFPNDTQY